MEKLSFKLEHFEGPLDLLLSLIAKNKLDIHDIMISELLDQYLLQLDAMRAYDMDIASEFLEMAARLVHIKTVSLLPKHEEAELLRQELTGELLEYELCRKMAAKLAGRTAGFDRFTRAPAELEPDKIYRLTHPASDLADAYLAATGRGRRRLPPPVTSFSNIVAKKIVSVSSKIVYVLRSIWAKKRTGFDELFRDSASRSEVVATFLAVLELMKARRVAAVVSGKKTEIVLLEGGNGAGNSED